jgi:SAM-dependent methyltransferase
VTRDDLIRTANSYRWYHRIKIEEGIYTESVVNYQTLWDFILNTMRYIDFKNKRVLDVGCRDGMFSFEAERKGAREILGIDNDLSRGAIEFLIPHFRSNVRMKEINLYDLDGDKLGKFDIIMCYGVLYHLRYPIMGLKKLIDLMEDNGQLLIESGMMTDKKFKNFELLYLPVERSPYEPTSCSFFNQLGLETTMRSLGCKLSQSTTFEPPLGLPRQLRRVGGKALRRANLAQSVEVSRQFFIFQKLLATTTDEDDFLKKYWHTTHGAHSRGRR